MKNSHRFFRNTECRYFPCHDNVDPATFNCLFCYCPLYSLGEQCGGRFEYVGTNRQVKCCTKCTFPHEPDNYDLLVAKLKASGSSVEPQPAGEPSISPGFDL